MKTLRSAVTFGLYPFLLATVILSVYLAIRFRWDYKSTYWMMTLFILAVLMVCERLFPLSDAWSMTGKSFFRDFRYILLDAPTIGAAKALFGLAAIRFSETHTGLFTRAPVVASTVAFLLVFEFFQYWYHRLSHSGQGPVGGFLWRAHVAHHLPDKVYVLMHAVFNPINAFISTAIIQVPLILLGLPPAAVLAASLLIDLQSLVSHFNADVRAGFLNYVFIGAETHRYHHSADLEEAKNFGNTLAIWDLVFGTHYYRPGKSPLKLGVADAAEYPASDAILAVLALPFTGKGPARTSVGLGKIKEAQEAKSG